MLDSNDLGCLLAGTVEGDRVCKSPSSRPPSPSATRTSATRMAKCFMAGSSEPFDAGSARTVPAVEVGTLPSPEFVWMPLESGSA